MATYYVSSVDGNDADAGTSWALAKATIAGALAVATTTGDVILVDSAHSYTAGATITWNVSAGIHISIISTDRTNGGVLAGATEYVGAVNAGFNIGTTAQAQSWFLQGLTIKSAANSGGSTPSFLWTGAVGTGGVSVVAKDCTFQNLATGGHHMTIGQTIPNSNYRPGNIRFENCTFSLSTPHSTGSIIRLGGGNTEFNGCAFTLLAGSAPTTLIATTTVCAPTRFVGCDFSAYASTNLISDVGMWGPVEFSNCKFHATPTLTPTGTWLQSLCASVSYVNCDSGDTEYKYAYYTREGALTVDTATYASSSATVAGTALSWKIVTTSDADEDSPFVTPWVSTWIDSTGSKTLSLELVYDSATNLTDREVWAEIEYLGNASFPVSTVYSSRNANPFTGTGTDLTAGSATWTEALTNDNKDKITTTVTVNGKGLARARLYVGKASQTLYLDPQLRVA